MGVSVGSGGMGVFVGTVGTGVLVGIGTGVWVGTTGTRVWVGTTGTRVAVAAFPGVLVGRRLVSSLGEGVSKGAKVKTAVAERPSP